MTPPDPLRVLNNDLTLQGLQHTAHNSHSMSLYHLLWDKWSIDLAKWTLFLSDGQYQHHPPKLDNSSLYYKLDLIFEVVAIISIGYNTFVLRVTVAEAAFQSNTSYTVIYYHYYAIMDDSN